MKKVKHIKKNAQVNSTQPQCKNCKELHFVVWCFVLADDAVASTTDDQNYTWNEKTLNRIVHRMGGKCMFNV